MNYFGLSPDQYQFICKSLRPLTQNNIKCYCFGSRARGDNGPFSDLDIMLEGNSLSLNELSALKEAFENSDLPFKVDIMHIEHFASEYKHNYEKDKVDLFSFVHLLSPTTTEN